MARKPRAAPASGDGGIANPITYASVEEILAARRAQTLTLPNGLKINAGEFDDMDYESQRAFLANVENTPLEELE